MSTSIYQTIGLKSTPDELRNRHTTLLQYVVETEQALRRQRKDFEKLYKQVRRAKQKLRKAEQPLDTLEQMVERIDDAYSSDDVEEELTRAKLGKARGKENDVLQVLEVVEDRLSFASQSASGSLPGNLSIKRPSASGSLPGNPWLPH